MTTVNGINDKGQIVGFDTAGAATSGFVVNVPVALATDTTSHTTWQQALSPYTGPLSYLSDEFIDVNPENLDLTATTPNVFLHSGPGEDALTVLSGQNVLDGGTGSNFLTDGSGTDTDFVDARGATKDIWSTMNNFSAGDSATVFGVTQAEFTSWANGQGAAGIHRSDDAFSYRRRHNRVADAGWLQHCRSEQWAIECEFRYGRRQWQPVHVCPRKLSRWRPLTDP